MFAPPIDITLFPKQQMLWDELMTDTYTNDGRSVNTIVGYGGARGGSKSYTLRTFMLLRRCLYPHSIGFLFRSTLKELNRNHIEPLLAEHPWLEKYYYPLQSKIHLPDPFNSIIYFGYGENYNDILKWRGAAHDDLFVDEASEEDERTLKFLLTTCRKSSERVSQKVAKAVFAFNWGGAGHAYLQRIFWDKDNYMPRENPKAFYFMHSKLWDNYHWVKEIPGVDTPSMKQYFNWSEERRRQFCIDFAPYVNTTLANLDEYEWKAAVEGDPNSFEGQFFSKFSSAVHVIEPFDIPSDWNFIGGLDWGNDTALEMLAQSPEGDFYVFDEFFTDETDIGVSMRANMVCDFLFRKGYDLMRIAGDINLWTPDTGNTRREPVQEFYSRGINRIIKVIKGKVEGKDYRVAANDRVKELIYWRKDALGKMEVKPRLYIFKGKAPHLLRTMPMLMADVEHPGDFIHHAKNKQDHCYDGLKYAVMNIAKPAPKKEIVEMTVVPPNRSVSPIISGGSPYARY